jgi:hypothetical protein
MEEICYVYIIRTTTEAYKIGVAIDPWARHDALRPGIPDPSELLLIITCRNRRHAFAVESGIHRELDQYRSAGEWFRPPKSVLGEMILELGSRIEALAADTPTIAYAPRPKSIDSDPDIIAYGCSKSTRDLQEAIKTIIRNLDGERKEVHEDLILQRAEEVGIDRKKAAELIDRMGRDGEVFRPCLKKVRIF